VHPCDQNALEGAIEAQREGLIVPVLVGPEARIRSAAEQAGIELGNVEIVDAPHSHAAARLAVEFVRAGSVDALMKGALHTDEIMAPVIDKATGLRTERRMSHVFALDVPTYPKPLFVTDGALNIYPDLGEKRDIVQNAIDLAHALGIATPKVAILSAVETVNPKIVSTVEAAALCKMADRGQITGGFIDGPLAFDNAISREAAEAKGIVSQVAGDADRANAATNTSHFLPGMNSPSRILAGLNFWPASMRRYHAVVVDEQPPEKEDHGHQRQAEHNLAQNRRLFLGSHFNPAVAC
jgi:phosphate acetyltransferase